MSDDKAIEKLESMKDGELTEFVKKEYNRENIDEIRRAIKELEQTEGKGSTIERLLDLMKKKKNRELKGMLEPTVGGGFKEKMMEKYKVNEEEYEALTKALREPRRERRGFQILAVIIELRRKRLETST